MGRAADEFFDDGLTGQMELGGGEAVCSPDAGRWSDGEGAHGRIGVGLAVCNEHRDGTCQISSLGQICWTNDVPFGFTLRNSGSKFLPLRILALCRRG